MCNSKHQSACRVDGNVQFGIPSHPGGNPGANIKSISHRCYLFEVAFVWELTKETIRLPLGCIQGGYAMHIRQGWRENEPGHQKAVTKSA